MMATDQVRLAAIVQEEEPLAERPKRSCSELLSRGLALTYAVGKSAHLAEREIGERMKGRVVQAGRTRRSRGEGVSRMAQGGGSGSPSSPGGLWPTEYSRAVEDR